MAETQDTPTIHWAGEMILGVRLTHTPPPGKLHLKHAGFHLAWEGEGRKGATYVPIGGVDLVVEVDGHQFLLRAEDLTVAVLAMLEQAQAAAAVQKAFREDDKAQEGEPR